MKHRDRLTIALAVTIGLLFASDSRLRSIADPIQTGSSLSEPVLLDIVRSPVPLREGIGIVSERVSTSSSQAGAFYNQGLAYLHSFVWIEAARSFNEAVRRDPDLAMAHVGLSYAFGELGMSDEARRASARASQLADRVSPRERMAIELRQAQLDAAAAPNAARRAAYETALAAALAAYPMDVEFLLIVGQAQDSSHDGHGMNAGSASLPFYLRALAQAPDYFATHHLLTHAYENSGQFDQALEHAARYARETAAVPHAHHMYGHVLRRVNRMTEAIAEFEKADRLETSYLQSESIPARYDWHYRHNLSLLGSSYQYLGRIRSADVVLRRSFDLEGASPDDANLDRKQFMAMLIAARRFDDALTAARSLMARPQPILQAVGHLMAGRAWLGVKRPNDAASEGNLALTAMRAAGPAGGVLVPDYELLQGEFLLRTGQAETGRNTLRRAVDKFRAESGPDAWVATLFTLEAAARTASELGEWPLVRELAGHMRALDATYAGTQYVLGLVAEHDRTPDVALTCFQEAARGWADADQDFSGLRDARESVARLTSATPGRRQ